MGVLYNSHVRIKFDTYNRAVINKTAFILSKRFSFGFFVIDVNDFLI